MDRTREGLNNSNIVRSVAAAPRLPVYALYGEQGRTRGTDWLHCETIAERSRRHDWEIQPHRHGQLFQFLHIHRGRAEVLLDRAAGTLNGPGVLAVPALVPHGFRFSRDVDGTVVTVVERHLARLLAGTPALSVRVMQAWQLAWTPGDEAAQAVHAAMRALRHEFAASGAWRDLALDAALLRLAVALGRAAPATEAAADAAAPQRALAHVRRLRALVETRFREQPTQSELAGAIGITPTQLNRACRQVLGHPALAVLHDRLVLEAQRELAYTTMSIKQIALGLGFGDAGYFTRFFQRKVGQTPTAWRALAAR